MVVKSRGYGKTWLTALCCIAMGVEYAQPSGSSSDYVIGVDLATSTDRKADNAVICVIKLADMENGAWRKPAKGGCFSPRIPA